MRVRKKLLTKLTYSVIGCAIEVYKNPGPGLLECDDEKGFLRELEIQGINYKKHIRVPVR